MLERVEGENERKTRAQGETEIKGGSRDGERKREREAGFRDGGGEEKERNAKLT